MWLATKHGFFSVVCGRTRNEIDKGILVIRARRRQHLENIAELLGNPRIESSDNRDYPFRVCVFRAYAERAIAKLAADIDYDNFKDAASAEHPEDSAYRQFLHRVWSHGCDMEITEAEYDRRVNDAGKVRGLPRMDFDQSEAAARAERCNVEEADDPL